MGWSGHRWNEIEVILVGIKAHSQVGVGDEGIKPEDPDYFQLGLVNQCKVDELGLLGAGLNWENPFDFFVEVGELKEHKPAVGVVH